MNASKIRVEPLTKVTLSMAAVPASGERIPAGEAMEAAFVFGLGSGGLTPFEYEIAGKAVGDALTLHLPEGVDHRYFAHLGFTFHQIPQNGEPVTLTLEIRSIEPASGREVVQAMARAAHGCSCGCGCG